jgi:hypothetical protein
MNFSERIFQKLTETAFNDLALDNFRFQLENCRVYSDFVRYLGVDTASVRHYRDIPFLPVGFFKTAKVYASNHLPEKTFLSSGTTGMERSRHEVADLSLYRESLASGFRNFYGDPGGYRIIAFTPTPEEAPDSSLVYMINELISLSGDGGFADASSFPPDSLLPGTSSGRTMVIGLTFALLDFIERNPVRIPDLIVVETGGMKGRRREMIREELHHKLKGGFGADMIHSEYGMSELLSQAWSSGEGIFTTPPWMKILIRDVNDPLEILETGRSGGVNIIDLANRYSCSFIATHDLGKVNADGSFEILGRFDDSDLRGCSLLIS